MQTLAYTTSIMSWGLLLSAIRRVRESENSIVPIDLNMEAPPCAILCCIALEAFVNEISCLTSAFLFNEENNHRAKYSTKTQREANIGMAWDNCQNIGQIKDNPRGSFYDRYKALLKVAGIEKPNCIQSLSYLRDLRDALVHFRVCEVPIVEDSDGVIRSAQEPPEVFAHLKSYSVNGWPVVATDPVEVGTAWVLRASTNAMAVWSLNLVLEAITYVLDILPAGEYRDFILRRYAARDVLFSTVFEKGKADIEEWKNDLFLV